MKVKITRGEDKGERGTLFVEYDGYPRKATQADLEKDEGLRFLREDGVISINVQAADVEPIDIPGPVAPPRPEHDRPVG